MVDDSRPRVMYRLPDGRAVPIIFDHGDSWPMTITYTLEGGKVVTAERLGEPFQFGPETLYGTVTGRFDSSRPNLSNAVKGKIS